MSIEQFVHAAICSNITQAGPAVLVVSESGLDADAQVRQAVTKISNDLDAPVKMSGHTSEDISYIEILAKDVNTKVSSGFSVHVPLEDRLNAAAIGRHTIVLIDCIKAPQRDVDAVVDLLNSRKFNTSDLSQATIVVISHDENFAERVNDIAVVFNDVPKPLPLNKARVSEQRTATPLVCSPKYENGNKL